MAGEFMETADQAAWFVRKALWLFWTLLYLALVAFPYIGYRCTVNAFVRATTKDRIWICEQNPMIAWGDLQPPQPEINGKGTKCPIQRYYACVNTIKEAEDWLLKQGYKRATLYTTTVGDSSSDAKLRYFFSKYAPGTDTYSFVGLMIDYGDYDIRLVPYNYNRDKSPVNFARFQEEDFRELGQSKTRIPPMIWLSTNGHGSHIRGGRCRPNENARQFMMEYRSRH